MHPFQHQSSKSKKLYTAILLLSLTAVVVTLVLIQAHFQPSEAGSFCNINDYWNCDRVNKSIFAEILGIPISIFGFIFYSFFSLLIFGLIKGWSFPKWLAPLKPKWILALAALGATAVSAGLMYYEFTILGNLAPWAIIKNGLFIITFWSIFRYSQKYTHPTTLFLAFLAILALFGVNFSLYLTDVELFVLEGMCIFCFTQQIIIIIISTLLIFALKQNKHELSQSKTTTAK